MITPLPVGKRLVVITLARTEAKLKICPMFIFSTKDSPNGPSAGLEQVEFDCAFL